MKCVWVSRLVSSNSFLQNISFKGSRDGTIALWSIYDDLGECCSPPMKYSRITPNIVMKDIDCVDRIRDLVYNDDSKVSFSYLMWWINVYTNP